ncbi:hypothetical protein TNCV_5093661 [Trichonephila clavipes]|nr:hypothetical protein TNCV_5093661 [Trichonephila clavipes]
MYDSKRDKSSIIKNKIKSASCLITLTHNESTKRLTLPRLLPFRPSSVSEYSSIVIPENDSSNETITEHDPITTPETPSATIHR